jgi:hypothetical protein
MKYTKEQTTDNCLPVFEFNDSTPWGTLSVRYRVLILLFSIKYNECFEIKDHKHGYTYVILYTHVNHYKIEYIQCILKQFLYFILQFKSHL